MKGYHLRRRRFYFPFSLETLRTCKTFFFKTEQVYHISRMLTDCAIRYVSFQCYCIVKWEDTFRAFIMGQIIWSRMYFSLDSCYWNCFIWKLSHGENSGRTVFAFFLPMYFTNVVECLQLIRVILANSVKGRNAIVTWDTGMVIQTISKSRFPFLSHLQT